MRLEIIRSIAVVIRDFRTVVRGRAGGLRSVAYGVVGLAMVVVLAGCGTEPAPVVTSAPTAGAEVVAPVGEAVGGGDGEIELGRRIYEVNCAACHGMSGEGEPDWQIPRDDYTRPAPPHDASGHTWHHADGQLYEIVLRGGKLYESPTFKSRMIAYEDILTPEEIKAVLEYIKTFWGPEEIATQARISAVNPYPE